mgnify:CR=1 FL=1
MRVIAVADPVVVGIGCHSITRAGWTGPLVVDEAYRRRGIGQALLGEICRDLMIAEFDNVVGAAVTAVINGERTIEDFAANICAEAEIATFGG